MSYEWLLVRSGSAEASDVLRSSLGSMYEILVQGGWLMVPIALCSVLVVAYTIERALGLRRRRIVPPGLVRSLEEYAAEGRIDESRRLCEENASPMAAIALSGIRRSGRPVLEVEKAMEDAGLREVSRLRRNVRPLATVAGIAPLLGLLGTVLGMIEAFHVVAGGGLGRQELLASGIAKALVTTGAGLTVAIPALAFYHYFSGRIHRLVLEIDEIGVRLAESLAIRARPDGAPSGASAAHGALAGGTRS